MESTLIDELVKFFKLHVRREFKMHIRNLNTNDKEDLYFHKLSKKVILPCSNKNVMVCMESEDI